jgi:hypothetical protein
MAGGRDNMIPKADEAVGSTLSRHSCGVSVRTFAELFD